MKLQRSTNAFTLIELLVVIAIIGILAAMIGPSIGSFRKGDAMAAATSQLLGGVARGRQLAIANHTDVYMVFLPTNYWGQVDWTQLPVPQRNAERVAITNLVDKQLTGYAFLSFRTVGDQPGQQTFKYLSGWQSLPEGIFIPEEKFNIGIRLTSFDSIDKPEYGTNVWSFNRMNNIPFPTETSPARISLPYIAFDYQGRLIASGSILSENIPLAHGSIFIPKNPQTKQLQLATADALERPAGNSISGYHIIHVDGLTGRGHLERREVQ